MKITAEFETAEEFLAFMYGKLPINEKTRERLVALDIIHEATQNGATLASVPSENVPTRVGVQYPTEAAQPTPAPQTVQVAPAPQTVQVAPTPAQTATPAAMPTTPKPTVAPAPVPTQTAAAPTAPAQNPTAPTPNPTVTPTPVAAPAPLPTTATTYSLDEILKAAASLMDQGRTADLQALLTNYGVPKVSMLPPEQLGAFATDLRQMGAVI